MSARPVLVGSAVPLVVLVATLLVGVPAAAQPAADPVRTGADDDPRAVELVQQAALSPTRVSFTGTQYVTLGGAAGSAGAVVDVSHRAGGPTSVHVRGVGEHRVPSAAAGRWLAGGGPVGLLADAYAVTVAGREQVAGRTGEVVEARRDDGTLAARLWIDVATGLPLRREVHDADGALVRGSAFVDLTVLGPVGGLVPGLASPGEPGNGAVRRTSTATGGDLDHADLRALRRAGLACPESLGEDLVLYQARRVHGSGAVQLSYSDGLVSVSVFEQPGRLDEAAVEGFAGRPVGEGTVWSRPGPPSWAMWSTGSSVVTVVSDEPSTLPAVVAALPPVDPMGDAGLMARVGRGAGRVAAWFNPFD